MFSHKKVWTKSFLFLLKYFSKEVFRQNSYLQKCFLFPNFLLKFFLARKFYNKDKCCPQNFFWSKLSLTLIVYPTFCFIFLGWFLMIEPRYKNNKIFMDFDSIEMNLQGVPREVLKTKRPLLSTQSILLSKIGGYILLIPGHFHIRVIKVSNELTNFPQLVSFLTSEFANIWKYTKN